MIRKIFLILAFSIIITGCVDKTDYSDFNEVERLKKEIKVLKGEAKEIEKELERLRDIEILHDYQFTHTPYINMYSSSFLFNLQEGDLEGLNRLSNERLRFEKKNDEIYAITPDYEKKITYNNDKHTINKWFIETVEFKKDGSEAEATVRYNYVDENSEIVSELMYFKLNFIKSNDNWFLKDLFH